ncbi:hypothetical protein EVA_15854 [gut metagenome]|uniref:Uncharacterized protein n=1 Tax=gut metagenome TaxID=749906 RepID=J9G9E0_9ZZZZ
MQFLVCQEVTFESSHLVLVEQRRLRSAPHIPHIIQCEVLFLLAVLVKVSRTDQLVTLVEQLPSPILLPFDLHMLKAAVLVQRHRCMIKQVRVGHQIHPPIRIQTAHVLLQLLTVAERIMNLLHQLPFFLRQLIRIGRVHRREMRIPHLVILPLIHKHAPFEINLFEQLPTLHGKLRTTVNDLSLQLKLDNRNRLVHLRNQAQRLLVVLAIRIIHLRHENLTRIIAIHIHGKRSQGQQIDSVAILQRTQIAIPQRHAHHVGYAAVVARSRSHPENIVISPLDVEVVIVAQRIHNDMRSRSAVVDIPHNVQRVDGEPLNQVTHRNDKIIRPLR